MTQQEFIDKINQAYYKASDLLEGKGEYDILRGTAHPVSGYMEDAFALYMANRIGDTSLQFLVDKLISYRGRKGAKAVTFKPDLSILKNSELIRYYDLKTNLGWNRDLEKYIKNKNKLIEKIKGKKGWIHFPHVDVDNPGFEQQITYSPDLKYQMVIYSGWNINQDQLRANIELSKTLENVELYVLQTWDENTKKLNVDQSAFDKLL